MFTKLLKTDSGLVGLVARLALAIVIFPHGAQKVLGWFGGYGLAGSWQYFTGQFPAPLVALQFAAEFLGSIGLALGLLSRASALGIAGVMIVAALTAHLPNGFFMNWLGNQAGEGFEYHILAVGLAAAGFIGGGGKFSLDGWLARRKA